MPIDISKDAIGVREEPDAHGQAELLLAESVIHALVATHTFSQEEANHRCRSGRRGKAGIGFPGGRIKRRIQESLGLLERVRISLRTDNGPNKSNPTPFPDRK